MKKKDLRQELRQANVKLQEIRGFYEYVNKGKFYDADDVTDAWTGIGDILDDTDESIAVQVYRTECNRIKREQEKKGMIIDSLHHVFLEARLQSKKKDSN